MTIYSIKKWGEDYSKQIFLFVLGFPNFALLIDHLAIRAMFLFGRDGFTAFETIGDHGVVSI